MNYTVALGLDDPDLRISQQVVLSVDGERVVDCDYREDDERGSLVARLEGLAPEVALERLSEFCDDCAHAHRLAFCQATEELAGVTVPARALALRSLVGEFERIVSHLAAIERLLAALNLPHQKLQFERLRADVQAAVDQIGPGSIMQHFCVLGGVAHSLNDETRSTLAARQSELAARLYDMIDTLIDQRALLAATAEVGTLSQEAAQAFMVRGPLARASNLQVDVRKDSPYAFYDQLDMRVVSQEGGDVYARLMVLALESYESFKLIEQILANLPEGDWKVAFPDTLPSGTAQAHVEAPRGELVYSVSSNGRHITAVQVDAPRQIDRLLARTFLIGALIDDIPLIMVSLDVCPSCNKI